MIEAVFFDAGETLLSPKPSWSELSVEILRRRGHNVALDAMRSAWRHTGEHFVRAADEGRTFSTSHEESKTFWVTLYEDLLAFLGIDDRDAPVELYETFSDPNTYTLFDDSVSTLDALEGRGLKLGVISNFEGWLRGLLDHLDVKHRFDVLAISGELGWEKPDPRIFEWAMEEAGVDAASSVHIGDSPHFDPAPAVELGMHGVLLDRHGRWADLDVSYPRVTGLRELVDLIDTLR